MQLSHSKKYKFLSFFTLIKKRVLKKFYFYLYERYRLVLSCLYSRYRQFYADHCLIDLKQ